MRSTFSTPEYTSGVTAEVPADKPQTEDRTWGQFAKDVAIDAVASPLVGAIRTGTQAWRMAEDDAPTPRAVDQALGSASEWLKGERSDRARALDTQSIDPRGDERSFWKEPFAGSIHAFLPSTLYAAGAIATAGTGLLAEAGAAGLAGAFQTGDAVNDLRDYADTTKLGDLRKLEPFEKFYREFNGDETAARNALFKSMLDPKSQALNFLVNSLEVPAFRLGMRPSGSAMRILDRAKAAGLGAVTGGTQGALEGGAQAYVEDIGRVRSGQQERIDPDKITTGIMQGGVFAGPMAAFHAVAPTYKRATALGATEEDVLNKQINPEQEQPPPGAPPGAPPGTPPVAPPGTPPVAPPGAAPPTVAPPGAAAQVAPDQQAAPPREPPDVSDAVSIFKTAKGSEYFMMPDGTTIRNKAPRPEHPGEQGWMEPSQQTLFITPEHADQLGALFQAETRFGKRIAMTSDGRVGVQYTNGPSAGKFERRTVGRPLDGPQVGATPVELWSNGQRAHFGNAVTEVMHKPGTQAAGEQFGPHGEPLGPQLQPPPRLPVGRMTWSGAQGFTTSVNVMDRPPVFQNGTWMQAVAVRNPGTGQTHTMLAPIEELAAQAGPPAPGRTQEPPPVQTPQQPLPPQFPEIESPDRPYATPTPYHGPPSAPEFVPKKIEPGLPGPPQMTSTDYDLIRGGIALWDNDTRKKIADKLEGIAKERPPTVEDIPGVLRNQLDREQHAALKDAIERFPADAIENIRQSPQGLAQSPVLQDLQERFRRQKEQQRAAPKPAAEPAADTLVGEPYRRGVEATQQERDLVLDIAHYNADRKPTHGEWLILRRRAQAADERRTAAGIPAQDFLDTFDARSRRLAGDAHNFIDMLGPPPTTSAQNLAVAKREQRDVEAADKRVTSDAEADLQRRAEGRYEAAAKAQQESEAAERQRRQEESARLDAEVAADEAEARETQRDRYHPLVDPTGKRPVLSAEEQRVHADVKAFNEFAAKRRAGPPMTKGQRIGWDVGRKNLERRMAPFNISAEERGLDRLTLDSFEPPKSKADVAIEQKAQRKEERRQGQKTRRAEGERREAASRSEFAKTSEQLARMLSQGEVPTQRTRTASSAEPGEAVAAAPRASVRTHMQQLVDRLEKINAYRLSRNFDPFPVPSALYDRLLAAGLIKTTEAQQAETAREKEAGAALQKVIEDRLTSVINQRGATGAPAAKLVRAISKRFGVWRKRAIQPSEQKLFRRNKDETKAWVGTKTPALGSPGNFRRTIGIVSERTAADREAYDSLSDTDKRLLRRQGLSDRVVKAREIEEIVRDVVLKHESTARERVAAGKPPLQMGARGIAPGLNYTPIERRGGRYEAVTVGRPYGGKDIPTQEEAIKRTREHLAKEKGKSEQRTATGRLGGEGTRGRDFAKREDIIRKTFIDTLRARLGVGKRYNDLLARLTQRTVTEGNRQVSLLNRPRMPDSLVNLGDRPWTTRHQELLDRWEADVAAWLKGKEAKVEAAEKFKTDVDHILSRIEADLAAHAKTKTGKGSITWTLPQKVWDQEQQKFTYRAGVSSPHTAYYNFANDLQKVSEELRYMLVGLGRLAPEKQQAIKRAGEPEAVRQPGITRDELDRRLEQTGPQRVLPLMDQIKQIINPDVVLRRAEGATRARTAIQGGMRGEGMAASQTRTRVASAIDEFARYTNPLDQYMQEFAANLALAQKGEEGMKLIEEARDIRSKQVSEARGVSRRAAGALTEAELGRFAARELTGAPERLGIHPDEVQDRDTGEYRPATIAEDVTVAPGIGASDIAGLKQIESAYEPSAGEGIIKGARRAAETRSINIVEEQVVAGAAKEWADRVAKERRELGDDYDRVMKERREQSEVRWTHQSANIGKVRPGLPGFDEKGLPANRLSPHEEFMPYSEEEQTHLDAHNQLNNDATPTHALISPVEGSQATLDRVKDLVAEGHTGIVPEQYVTNDFLDRLAAITRDTEVYHAPYDTVSGIGDDSLAYYDTKQDRVVLPSDVSPELYVRSALHEHVHAATERSLLTDPVMRGEVNDLLQLAVAAAERRGIDPDKLPRDLGGLTNASEFVAEAVSNKKFREFLFAVPAPHSAVIQGAKNVLNALYRAIRGGLRRVFGNAKDGDTALDVLFYDQSTVLGQADAMIKRSMKRLERHGRPDRAAAVQTLDEGEGRRYLSLSAGARAFGEGLSSAWDRAAFQVGQVKNENRAPGMSWRSMYDQTKIGSEEFKGLTGDLFRTFEEMHGKVTSMRDADKREIAALGNIWNKFSKAGRERAGKFMIDEGMHTAWADAPLNEQGPEYLDQATGERVRDRIGKNAHIDVTSLRDAQVVHEHPRLQRELQALERDQPGFKEFRERTYAFTAKREQEIRRNRYRGAFAPTDFMPENIEGKARDRLLDAFERWTDPEQKTTPADMKVFKDAGVRLNDSKMVEFRDDVRATKEFQKIVGPYSPFTRYGDWALSGRFKIDTPKNAVLLNEDVNEVTGEPVDEARFAFRTEAEARAFVHKTTDELGIAQLEGGQVWIDTRTKERPRVPDKRHEGKERLATNAEIERAADPAARKKLDPAVADALDPKHLQQHHYVAFQPKLLEMHPDQFTANANMQAWLEDPRYKGKIEITKPKDVFRHDGRQNEHYTSTQMQTVLNTIRAGKSYQRLDANEQAAITRDMNLASEQYILRRGFKQRYLPRNYVKGATTHVLASLDDYSATSSRYLGKVQYASQLKAESEKIKTYLKDHEYDQGDRNAVAQNRAYTAMMRRIHNPTRNPHENFVSRAIDRAMRITMLDKLPNVAYFTVNATETITLGLSLMVGRHSVANSVRTMAKYYKVAGVFGRFRKAAQNDIMEAFKRGTKMTNFVDLFNDAIDQAGNRVPFSEGLKDLMRQAAGRNHFDVSASLEYQSSFPTSRKAIDVGLDYGQGLFQSMNTAIENLNRFVSLATAYDLEMRRLLDVSSGRKKARTAAEADMTPEQRHQAAADYAMDILHQANGVYTSYNAPEMFTREGPLGMFGPMVFQFKKWPQRITMIYLRSGLGMMKGLAELAQHGQMTPEHKEAARQFVAMVAMVGLVAGALGMPTEPFSVATNLAFMSGISRYNWNDVEAGFRAWMTKQVGRDAAQFVAHGPLSFFTGADVGSRLSQSQMWAFGSPASNKPRDLYASLLGLIGGASFSTGAEVLQGFQKGVEGAKAMASGADDVAYRKFGESAKHLALIRFVADTLGSFMGSEGTELSSGRKLGPTLTPWERLVKAGGFTPTREAEAREARGAITSLQKRETEGRKAYVDNFVQSPPGLQRERVWQNVQQNWNPSHPGMEITQSDLLKALNAREKAKAEDRGQLGIPQNRSTRALMPMAEGYGYR